jgi:hypothetical protein
MLLQTSCAIVATAGQASRAALRIDEFDLASDADARTLTARLFRTFSWTKASAGAKLPLAPSTSPWRPRARSAGK